MQRIQTVRGPTGLAPESVKVACDYSVTGFLNACEKGDLETLVACFPHCKHLSFVRRDDEGRELNPLHIACKNNQLEVVKWLLLNTDMDVNQPTTDPLQQSALSLALESGHSDVAKFLINSHSANYTMADAQGVLPFHLACKHNQIEIVKLLFRLGGLDVNQKTDGHRQQTALSLALESGHMKVAQFLVQHAGADPTIADDEGVLPLHLAAKQGYTQLFEELLDKGSDITAKPRNGDNVLDYACKSGNKDFLRAFAVHYHKFMEKPDPDKPVNEALRRHYDMIEELWSCRPTPCNETPYLKALKENHRVFNTAVYINLGVDKVADDKLKRWINKPSAIDDAILHNDLALLDMLLKMGADPAEENDQGFTPTQVAVLADNPEALALLLAAKNTAIVAYGNQSSALHMAAYCSVSCLKVILSNIKFGLDGRDYKGKSPMDYACFAGQLDNVIALQEAGADLHSRHTKCGRLAIHHAAAAGHKAIVERLFPDYLQTFEGSIAQLFRAELIYEASVNEHWPLVAWVMQQPGGYSQQHLDKLMVSQPEQFTFELLLKKYKSSNACADSKPKPGAAEKLKKRPRKTKDKRPHLGKKVKRLPEPTRLERIIEQAAEDKPKGSFNAVQQDFLQLVMGGHIELVELYLDTQLKYQLLNHRFGKDGIPPLHHAIKSPDPKTMIPYLITQGATVSQPNKAQNATVLHYAFHLSADQAVECLLDYTNAEMANAPDVYGHTPLHKAVQKGASATYGVLAKGGNPVVKSLDGETPLSLAPKNSLTRSLLLEALEVRKAQKTKPAAFMAEDNVDPEMLKFHMLLCGSPKLSVVQEQLKKFTLEELDNPLTSTGLNALHIAAYSHRDDIVQVLVNRGCNSLMIQDTI